MTDLYLVVVTTSAGQSHHSVPGEHLPLVLEQLTQAAALLGEPPPTVDVQPLQTTHPSAALPGMVTLIQRAEQGGLLSSTSRGYLRGGHLLTPEQLIKAHGTRRTAVEQSADITAQMNARQILGDTLRLLKLSISEQVRRYAELNAQREQISDHIITTYQPN